MPVIPLLTEVPPHILIVAQLSNMERSQLNLAGDFVNKIKNELDDQDIGGGYQARIVMKLTTNHWDKIIKERK